MKRFISVIFFMLLIYSLLSCDDTDDTDVSASSLLSFGFEAESNRQLSLDIAGEINGKEIKLIVPHGCVITSLTPTFSFTGDKLCEGDRRLTSGTSSVDFSTPVILTILNESISSEYTATVIESDAYFTEFSFSTENNDKLDSPIDCTISGNGVWFYLSHSLSLNSLTPDYYTYLGQQVTVEGREELSGTATHDFSSPVIYRVHELSGSYMDYKVSAYRLTELIFKESNNSFSGDYTATLEDDTITVEIPAEADLTALIPSFSYLGDSIRFNGEVIESGITSVDFSAPVDITIDAGGDLSHSYTVYLTAVQ